MAAQSLARRLVSEALGTALLLATVVGSGIMAERLAGGNVAVALLANTIATGAGLVALIFTFGPVSGAHFNPAVTLADALQRGLAWRDVPAYVLAQVAGAFTGVAAAHVMFEEALFSVSRHVRSGPSQLVSEFIATFGLLSVIWGVSRRNAAHTPFAVGSYITAAIGLRRRASRRGRSPRLRQAGSRMKSKARAISAGTEPGPRGVCPALTGFGRRP